MPPVAPLPAATNGHVTFGYFGRPERLNDGVVAAWSRILHALPDARLVLNSRNFAEARVPRRCSPSGSPRTAWRRERLDTDLHRAAAAHLGGLWRDRHRAGPVPAQRRHDDDRGAVAGRSGGDPGRPADGRDGSARRSCTPSGWTTGSPATWMPMSPARSPPGRTSARWRSCAPRCVPAWPPRRCWMPPAWPGGGTGLPDAVGGGASAPALELAAD